jgi:hypothetical protein
VFQKNKRLLIVTAVMSVVFAYPANADDYNYLSRSDKVSLTTGDAPKANLAIQTPTPWPPYVNKTRITGNGRRAVTAMEKYYSVDLPQSSPQTIVNVTTPPLDSD